LSFASREPAPSAPFRPAVSFLPPPSSSPAQLRALRHRLRLSIRDAGLTDLTLTDFWARDTPFWELEPSPLIIPADEWQQLDAALRQRARLVNAFLVDLYDGREALKAGVLPPELVFDNPYYRRPRHRLRPDRENPATLVRFDLVRTAEGWVFTDIHTNTPVGLSYAVQNRRFLTQEAGDYYRNLPDYRSIVNFPLLLLDALRALAPRPERAPHIVVLTTGPSFPFFSEHSFLARKMGLPLVRGDDLLVIDNCVYFKTVAGLERVDVIYRRLNDAHIDPVVFPTPRETAGIPGLLQCIRAGNVVLANDIGTGVAESRALHPHLDRLSRFYLGERLLLPQVPTLACGDIDQLAEFLDHRDDYRLLPAHDARIGQAAAPMRVTGRGLPRAVRDQPHAFVARRRLASLPLPALGGRPRPFRFSAYVLAQARHHIVLPGGVINLGADPPAHLVGPTVDVIVLANAAGRTGDIADLETTVAVGAQPTLPGSQAADSLCWLGRYLERAENTARMLAILDDVALEEIPAVDRPRWLPIWRGLLEALGQGEEEIHRPLRADFARDLPRRMALDPEDPSSLRHSINAALRNAATLRDYISPEAWVRLTHLSDQLDDLGGTGRRARRNSPQPAAVIEAVLVGVNAFLSTAERTMLHDAGWHFLRLGMLLERVIMTCSALRHILGALDADARAAIAPLDASLTYRDNPELSALLRMLGSQDAYRRLYQTRSQPRFVAELFLQQPRAPRGLLHALLRMQTTLEAIQTETGNRDQDPVAATVMQAVEALRRLPLSRYFQPAAEAPEQPLEEALHDLLRMLDEIHPQLSDRYFSHQANLNRTFAM